MWTRLRRAQAAALCTLLLFALAVGPSLAQPTTIPVEPLARYAKLNPSGVTVSGISSGAFFAPQLWLRLADVSQITGNPKGCWDWWGYSGDAYLGRNGKQMRAVREMIRRMLG